MTRSRKFSTLKQKMKNKKNKTRKGKGSKKQNFSRFRYLSMNNVEGFA